MFYRLGGDVRREEAHQVSARQLRGGGRGRAAGAQPLRDHQGLLRALIGPDPRPRREEPGPSDQRLEPIREYRLVFW